MDTPRGVGAIEDAKDVLVSVNYRDTLARVISGLILQFSFNVMSG